MYVCLNDRDELVIPEKKKRDLDGCPAATYLPVGQNGSKWRQKHDIAQKEIQSLFAIEIR